jgi:GNAT superfamily N-acetyltransferase
MGDDYAARIAAGQAFVTGDPVKGLIVLIDAADHLLLDNIAVDPAAHGTGVGRALLQFADREAVRRGYGELRLYTHAKMTENVALYARSGWTETHRATQNGFPRVFFRKTV